jgi:predicted dehydrogenase
MKLAIIGAGYMGRAHARVVNSLSKKYNVELGPIIDPLKENAEKVIREYGGRYYPSVDEALSSEEFKAVIIASPTRTHLELLEKLLDSGVEYALVEKPLGNMTNTTHSYTNSS